MSFGMSELFEDHHFRKMPADIEMVIGPTVPEQMPARYKEATEQYSSKVEIVHFPDGRNDIRNYAGGEPFSHPEEPDKGYKLLTYLWFDFGPHLRIAPSEHPLPICPGTAHGYMSSQQRS